MINRSNANRTIQLTHMVAKDLFTDSKKQVFSAKIGKWLGTIDTAEELNFEPKNDEVLTPVQEPINPNQLGLF